jgi:hypothetical protein
MREILLRIVIGGAVVSAFAILGDLLKPKSFAGIFGAAPSVNAVKRSARVGGPRRSSGSIEASSEKCNGKIRKGRRKKR